MLSSKLNNYSVSFTKRSPYNERINSFSGIKTNYTKSFCKIRSLTNDTLAFKGKSSGYIEDLNFKSVLDNQLVSNQNPDFKNRLLELGIKKGNLDVAATRIASLSRYLKEDMIGFIVPNYTYNNTQKGGYQWFDEALESLLKACYRDIKPDNYDVAAKELFGLLAAHDDYWKSDDFINYIFTLKKSKAKILTVKAIKELQSSSQKNPSFCGQMIEMWGIFTPLKAMEKLLNDGCAYSGEKLYFDDPNNTNHPKITPKNNASIEHIIPQSWGGPDDDSNYMVSSVAANSKRGNNELITFLKGN